LLQSPVNGGIFPKEVRFVNIWRFSGMVSGHSLRGGALHRQGAAAISYVSCYVNH